MSAADPPGDDVLAAFGLAGAAPVVVALPGGEGRSYVAGGAVLKHVHDRGEAGWVQALLHRVHERRTGADDGFRVARPLPTIDGTWVHDGWTASAFLPGLRPAAPDWDAVMDAGLRFGAAAQSALESFEQAGPPAEEVLAARRHRWAVADRVAWGEIGVGGGGPGAARVALPGPALEVIGSLRALDTDAPAPGTTDERAFVHGDLAGNVFLDADGTPVVLDVSPYLRPARWAPAIVIADAVLWNGAPLELAVRFAAEAGDRRLLVCALIYRLVAEQLAPGGGDEPRHGADLAPYRRVAAALLRPVRP